MAALVRSISLAVDSDPTEIVDGTGGCKKDGSFISAK